MPEDVEEKKEIKKGKDPYLNMDLWEFAIMATLLVVLFPWSLLFCVVFFGWIETKNILLALIDDLIRTIFGIFATLLIVVSSSIAIFIMIEYFSN
ncbi:MAG: hypothetical protein V6Z81_07240 [Parvularculales bacterium]